MPARTPLSELLFAQGVVAERALVDAAAGGPVRGSWWAHPQSHSIFRALQQLQDDPDALLCKLLDGKQTYVHRRLWPALVRLQAEDSLWPALSPAAQRLLQRVEREGAVQATGPLRLELERSLRVLARSVHTASGAHQVVLTAFAAHFSKAELAAGARLTLREAQVALAVRPADAGQAPGGRPEAARPTPRRVRPVAGAVPPRSSPRRTRPPPPPGRRSPRRR